MHLNNFFIQPPIPNYSNDIWIHRLDRGKFQQKIMYGIIILMPIILVPFMFIFFPIDKLVGILLLAAILIIWILSLFVIYFNESWIEKYLYLPTRKNHNLVEIEKIIDDLIVNIGKKYTITKKREAINYCILPHHIKISIKSKHQRIVEVAIYDLKGHNNDLLTLIKNRLAERFHWNIKETFSDTYI